MWKRNKKKGNIILSTFLGPGDFIRAERSCKTKIQAKIHDALQKTIREAKRTPLSENLKIEGFITVEKMIPDPLLQFFTHLVCGSDKRRVVTIKNKRQIKAICQDIIFATLSRVKKFGTNVMLGVPMKRITESWKVTDILNRMGHSISYTTVEELETKLTFGESNRGNT